MATIDKMEYDPIMCIMVPVKDQSFVVSYKDKKDNGVNKTINVEANNKNEAIQKAINKFRNSNEDVVIIGASAKDQRTVDADIEKIADYLWTWSHGGSPADPLHEIANELEKLDKTSKTYAEHQEFVKKNYKPLLDKVYADLKRTVNKRLEDGYKRIDSALKSR